MKVYLPAVEVEAEQPAAVAEKPVAAGQETILVAEDSEDVLHIVRRVLTKQGYTVLLAADPAEAQEIFARHEGEISLLLTDVVMPHMAGPELYNRLAAQCPSLRVLCMSGYPAHAAIQNGVISAGLPFLQKPFTSDTLLRRVREVLDS